MNTISPQGSTIGSSLRVYAFEVSVKGTDWRAVVNARTAGQAKRSYHMDVLDAWPDVPYTVMRCRKLGAARSSAGFIRNAEYRGLPEVRCGARVAVGAEQGVIVGHDESANFRVLFARDSKYRGQVLSVHPAEMRIIGEGA